MGNAQGKEKREPTRTVLEIRVYFSFKFHSSRETTNDKKKYNEELRNVTRYNRSPLTIINVLYLTAWKYNLRFNCQYVKLKRLI